MLKVEGVLDIVYHLTSGKLYHDESEKLLLSTTLRHLSDTCTGYDSSIYLRILVHYAVAKTVTISQTHRDRWVTFRVDDDVLTLRK